MNNNNSGNKILTPRTVEFVAADERSSANNDFESTVNIHRINLCNNRLTCCCEYKNEIICSGFSGELFFIDIKQFVLKESENITNTIVRCLTLIESKGILLIGTDAGELIVYDLSNRKILFREHSFTSIYNITLINESSFITSEKNGYIYYWEYIHGIGVFRTKKLFSVNGTVFSMVYKKNKLFFVNSFGEKYEFDLSKEAPKKNQFCQSNVFAIKMGGSQALYYGLANGCIIYEEPMSNSIFLEGHKDAVRDLALSKEEKWLFSASKDRTIRAWHNGTPKILAQTNNYLYQIIISNSGTNLFYVDGNGDLGKIIFPDYIDSINDLQNLKIIYC